jgi:hypothetical protein
MMLSPLSPISGNISSNDSSMYLVIGRGILHGKAPYLNFVDNKGPIIYFINAIGLFIGGTLGVWCLEVISLLVYVYFAWKISEYFGKPLYNLLGVLGSLLILSKWFQGGNFSEEYALPFITVSFYIFIKYFLSQNNIIPKFENIVLGICFGITFLLRPNMFGVWAGFCLVITIQAITKKEYLLFSRYILLFIVGVFIVLIPIMLFLLYKKAFNEFIFYVFKFNFKYASAESTPILYILSLIRQIWNAFLPLCLGVYLIVIKRESQHFLYYAGYILSLIFTIILNCLSWRAYPHYNMTLVPLYIPALTCLVAKIFSYDRIGQNQFERFGIPWFLTIIILGSYIPSSNTGIISNLTSNAKQNMKCIGKTIDDNTSQGDKIMIIGGFSGDCGIYLYTQREPGTKFIIQDPLFASITNEVDDMFDTLNYKSAVVVMPPKQRLNEIVENVKINCYLQKSYHLISIIDGYSIYKRNS